MMEWLAHDTALWVAISFVLFAIVAYRLGKNSVLTMLDSRINAVRQEIQGSIHPIVRELESPRLQGSRQARVAAGVIVGHGRRNGLAQSAPKRLPGNFGGGRLLQVLGSHSVGSA